jgi:uroporphyrinogen-III synthase
MSATLDGGLNGLVVLSFESRRAPEMAELIRRHGGTPFVAPSLREVPLEENAPALEFLAELEAGRVDVTILLTGVGTRTLVAALAPRCPVERLTQLLGCTTLVARGPKPVAALRELGLTAALTAPEPNTWRELLAALDAAGSLTGKRVAVQEYGVSNPELYAGLRDRGATVMLVPVYRWALPENVEPLREALRRWADGHADIVLFTSATQVEHVMQVAAELGLAPAVLNAARRSVVASIGPVCNDALRRHGFPVDLEPEHPKMGHLVAAVARHGRAALAAKCGRVA